jgi:hypothetical protein
VTARRENQKRAVAQDPEEEIFLKEEQPTMTHAEEQQLREVKAQPLNWTVSTI